MASRWQPTHWHRTGCRVGGVDEIGPSYQPVRAQIAYPLSCQFPAIGV